MAKALKAIYLVVGTNELKKKVAHDRLRSRVNEATMVFDYAEFEASALGTADQILTALAMAPLGSDQRIVVIWGADKLKNDLKEAVIDYLQHPNERTVLVLFADSLAANTRLYKAIVKHGKDCVINCVAATKKDIQGPSGQLVQLAKNYGLELEQSAIKELVERLGTDMTRLDSHLRHLSDIYGSGSKISAKIVKESTPWVEQLEPWPFLDDLLAKNLTGALEKYPHLNARRLLPLMIALVRDLICAHALDQRGCIAELPTQLGKQAWQVQKLQKLGLRNFTQQQLRSLLSQACDIDQALKTGAEIDEMMIPFIVSFCSLGDVVPTGSSILL